MEQRNLIIILIIDLIIIIGTIYLITVRYNDYKLTTTTSVKNLTNEEEQKDIISSTTPVAINMPAEIVKKEIRNIKFEYKSSKAQFVAIIGDFNNWKPKPLTKIKNNVWEITIQLEPGEYRYNYVVNSKVILDPYNKNIPVTNERGFKSSVLIVKPLSK